MGTTSSAVLLLLVAQPVSTSTVGAPRRSHWSSSFALNSTARLQLDDGNRTRPGDRLYDPSGENFFDLVTSLSNEASYKGFFVQTQVDTAFYFDEPVAAIDAPQLIRRQLSDRYRDTAELEYLSVGYTEKNAELTLGDYYMTLGRGMILAIRKVDDVSIDNKLRGGVGTARSGPLTATAFAGYLNIKNFEAGTGYSFEDPNDLIAGGSLSGGFGKYFRAGLNLASIKAREDLGQRSQVLGYSGSIELPRPVRWLSVYAELAELRRQVSLETASAERVGQGLYSSVTLYAGAFTVLLEGKWYDGLFSILPGGQLTSERQGLNRLSEPPTAERARENLLSNESVKGGRAQVDVPLGDVTPYASVGYYRDYLFLDADIYAAFAGARVHWDGGHATVETGYRGQFVADEALSSSGDVLLREGHGTVDVSQEITGPYSFEVFVDFLYSEESAGLGLDFWREGRVATTLSSRDGWLVFGAYEFYTKTPLIFDPDYFSIGAQWQIDEGIRLSGLYGGERAGLKCTGGTCRFFPGFEGARLELSVRL